MKDYTFYVEFKKRIPLQVYFKDTVNKYITAFQM